MEKYIGVKTVEAEPAWRTFHQIDGTTIYLKSKNPNITGEGFDDGYKVVYEDGYESWSPKEAFENSYKQKLGFTPMKCKYEPHQDRVIVEAIELQDKIEKLDKFIQYGSIYQGLNPDEKLRLQKQLEAMEYYLTILVERINNFK